jgi:hypothetical protein
VTPEPGLFTLRMYRIKYNLVKGRLHVRFSKRIPVRFGVRFAAKGVKQVIFLAEMSKQTIAMGNRKRIGFLFCLRTNRARNRTAIRTRVDGPLHSSKVRRIDIPIFAAHFVLTRVVVFGKQALLLVIYCIDVK